MPPAAPSPLSPAAIEVARRLVPRDLLPDADDGLQLVAVEQVCFRVPVGLARWFGQYGSRALLSRALTRARIDHPALASVTIGDEPGLCIEGIRESARVHGAGPAREGVVAMLAALTEQIGQLIAEQQTNRRVGRVHSRERLSSGVPGLDALMGGGIPAGDAVMLAGPTGTGKSTFGMLFAAEGLRRGESVVVAAFEEYPEAYNDRLRAFDVDPEAMIAANKLRITYLRPLDLSVDETLAEILSSVKDTGATRVVIDSLTGFEVALAPTFREDFRESLYRLVGALTATEVTVFMIHEAVAMSPDMSFTGERVSFITDDIIVQRYVEVEGAFKKLLAVVKMRRSEHSTEFRQYQVTATGAAIGEPLHGYRGIMSGIPQRGSAEAGDDLTRPGLTSTERRVFDALVRIGESSLEQLALRAGVTRDEAGHLVKRLVELEYAVRIDGASAANPSFRAVAQVPGE